MSSDITDDWIVLEVPHRGEPRAYAGVGRDSYLNGTYRAAERSGRAVFDRTTARELADNFGVDADAAPAEFAEADAAWVADLGAKHGWDTPLYRADWLLEEGAYQPEPVDEVDAAIAYNGHDLSGYYVVTSHDECLALLAHLEGDNAPRIGQCGPVRAASALRREAERIGWGEPTLAHAPSAIEREA